MTRPTRLFALCLLAAGLALPAPAQEPGALDIRDAAAVTLDEFVWTARPVVVFADTPADPQFHEQMRLLAAGAFDLIDRDVVVITDTDPAARTSLRQQLRPRGFALVLVGRDGQVTLRKPSPWSAREIARSIDKTPQRRQELRERRTQ
jgi:hypothetical protein